MNPIIQINGLSAGYDGKTVLNHVDLTVYGNDFLGIIGPNGGGKTTLIKCILGLHQPTKETFISLKMGKKFLKSTWDTYHNTTTSTRSSLFQCTKSFSQDSAKRNLFSNDIARNNTNGYVK